MKKLVLHAVAIIVLMATSMSAMGADIFKGARYQGIGKIKGQPIDAWVNITVDDGDLEFNMANSYEFAAEYTVKGQGQTYTMNVQMPGSGVVPLKTTDGGASLTGTFSRLGQTIDLWLLKIPAKLTASALPAEELYEIVGSADGYTAFVTVAMPNGQEMCATSEFVLSADDHSFKMTCDSPAMQKIFGTMQGAYRIEGNRLVMTDASGKKVSGEICDDGNYIRVLIGSSQGMTLSLVLIR